MSCDTITASSLGNLVSSAARGGEEFKPAHNQALETGTGQPLRWKGKNERRGPEPTGSRTVPQVSRMPELPNPNGSDPCADICTARGGFPRPRKSGSENRIRLMHGCRW
ncbi:MAG: hypothetical protein KKH41_08745 [Candidatus Thermoplasmatota archaeon]|nr:hypothetical protein [Euryarchaeota archaeon]MBU4031556.1 hypothetical protein [Candidatus Thermoplasmatota archaeon]MBU4070816.1 hypothetical protein [Candidatus Thermoplasmatota archaeon]MBU4144688.1 hypothetical protein [Candidatus Thermoplasmatota archaeon]MBU4592652.1 hypothetical protein [Candidatus Thermoplasmatota archaeon]